MLKSFKDVSQATLLFHGNDDVYVTSITSCDDVIDEINTKIFDHKIYNFSAYSRQNLLKFLTNNNLFCNKKQLVLSEVFLIISDKNKVNLV